MNTAQQKPNSSNWWPRLVIAGFILFIAYIGNFVRMAMSTDVDLVSKDYYKQEIAYQQHINTVAITKENNAEWRGLDISGWNADTNHCAPASKHAQIQVIVVLDSYSIENKIKIASYLFYAFLICRQHKLRRPEINSISRFFRRPAKYRHFSAKGSREFHGHVAKAAQANNAYFLACPNFPVAKR